jgi:hypothetical protein
MSSLFWVGGDATWNSTAGTKWATSSGGAGGAAAPTAADDVFFDAASGVVNVTLTAVAARSVDCTGFTGTITHPTATVLTIGTSTAGAGNVALKLVSGMTYTIATVTSSITFASTSGTQQSVDFGGRTTANVLFNGAGGSWQYLSSHVATGASVTLSNGTLDVNGQTCTWGAFSSTTSNTRTLTLGAASISLSTGGSTTWSVGSGTFTLNSDTSTITVTGAGPTFTGGGKTYNNVVISSSGIAVFLGANTFANLTRTGTAIKTDSVVFGASQTITGTLALNGNSATDRLLVQSDVVGTSRTLTAAALSVSNLDLMDIAGAGTANWNLSAITGLSGDCGGNSGITFTTASTQTATGTASFTWSTHGWTTHVPLPQDTVSIPNAFIATRTITMDMPRIGTDITCTCTGSPSMIFNVNPITIYGSFTLATGMTTSTANPVVLAGRGTHTVTTNGVSFAQSWTFNGPGGTYQLLDNLTDTSTITLTNGTLDVHGKNVTCTTFLSTGSTARTLILGGGTWTLTGNTLWNVTSTLTLSAAASTIVVTSNSSSRSFVGGGLTYGTLTYTAAGSTGALSITGANTFSTINFSDASNARNLVFAPSTTTTITDSFNVQGTAGKLMSVVSSTAGTAATISKASGTVACDYLSVKDSTATGGATFYAGSNSTNVSGNSGWSFTGAPTGTSGLSMTGID